jgi:hypothetical protein
MKTPSLWLQLYFVFASLLGLVLIVFGTATLTNTLLKATVLKNDQARFYNPPPQPYIDSAKLEGNSELSDEDKEALTKWRQDYQAFQEKEATRDYEAEGRRDAVAFSIAVLITGIPIFALHAPVIFRQVRD